ncbi:TPA: hypothetical protein ACPSKB_002122 [Legionella feeleii]|uniref:Uncharacterized protein n=1 Tax=Legionella feeleii TaxID=453 RepID=A0A378IQM9_9GAMM|nr:hypothetical protein [Legionella feeleii]STX37152.1 Uncharacterised protein [Legionella feeleii]
MSIGEQDVIELSHCFHSNAMEKSTAEFFSILKHESLSCNFNALYHFLPDSMAIKF